MKAMCDTHTHTHTHRERDRQTERERERERERKRHLAGVLSEEEDTCQRVRERVRIVIESWWVSTPLAHAAESGAPRPPAAAACCPTTTTTTASASRYGCRRR
jgi:hypothetical protein